jgi:hypothetical protein
LYTTDKGVSSVDAELEELFEPVDVAPPRVKEDGEIPDIGGSVDLSFDAEGGIKVLDWLLNKLKMGQLAGKASWSENYVVTVTYSGVKEDKVSLLGVDKYLSNAAPITSGFNTFRPKLENNELYVVTSVLKSDTLSMKIEAKNGADISADATVKGILEVNAAVARKKDNTLSLDYTRKEGALPMVFAFKAQRIIYEKENFWGNKPAAFRIKEEGGVVLLGPEDMPTIPLEKGDELVEID